MRYDFFDYYWFLFPRTVMWEVERPKKKRTKVSGSKVRARRFAIRQPSRGRGNRFD